MALAKYLKQAFKSRSKADRKELLVQLRREPATLRMEGPSRIDRARNLGYKAKQGFLIVRQRVGRGGHRRESYRGGKQSGKQSIKLDLGISYKQIAEMRVAKKYPNMEILNSYYLAKDGQNYWYEVIAIEPAHPAILADRKVNWICSPSQKGRVYRGKTTSGKKSRGLSNKGKGAEKARPSKAANKGRL